MFSLCIIADIPIDNSKLSHLILQYCDYLYSCTDYISVVVTTFMSKGTIEEIKRKNVNFIDQEYFDSKNFVNCVYLSTLDEFN